IYVVGDVEQAGAYDISSLSTPLNALLAAGGPSTRGSARVVRHMRGDKLIQEVDLYDLLLRGVRGGILQMQNGDTLLVPPLGGMITVEGAVRRPAKYELAGEKNLAQALELAGGILPTATLRNIQVQRLEAHQKRTMLSLDISESQNDETARKKLESFSIQDGDEIRIFPIANHNEEAIFLEGHVLRPGRYSYKPGMKVTDLVSGYADLLPEPAKQYGEIVRLNAPDFRPTVESFNLGAALANPAAAPELKPQDTVRIFSRFDFENPPSVWVGGEVRKPGLYKTSGQVHLRDAIQLAGGAGPDALMESAQVFSYQVDSTLKIYSVDLSEALAGNPIHNVLLQPRDRVIVHRNLTKADPPSVYVQGEIDKPGRYPLTANMKVSDLIRLSGGLKRGAFQESADLTRFVSDGSNRTPGEHLEISIAAAMSGDAASNVPLRDGDTLAIRQLPGWNDVGASILISGELLHPGTYGIKPGERLSAVLKRAGGMLPTAYAPGAVLERLEVRELQQKAKLELIRRVQDEADSTKFAMTADNPQEQDIARKAAKEHQQRVLETLRQAPITGRMVIRLYSNKRFEGSADDVEVRAGDRLYVPKRPEYVMVIGQVYNSNAVTFTPHKNAGFYLSRAGGPTELAEKGRIFIVRANGEVVTGQGIGWWGGGVLSTGMQPGDTLVVPERAIGLSQFWRNFSSIAQIASSVAVAVSVATR
ncbi:MAG: SLBB domain-containing protein, partial [Acidobacteria bacterium]|nr:SLBB domain-containing protein [Acidobacteriota bacterium]